MVQTFPFRLFLYAFLGWTFDFYDLVLFAYIKDPISREFHLSHSAESWLLGLALSTSGLGGILAGILADRYGKRSMLATTVMIYSLGSAVCGLAPNLWVFIFGRALVGLGVGGEWAIGHGLVAEAVESRIRGRAAALLQAGEPLGAALAAVVGFLLLPVLGWRAVLLGSSATALLAVAMRRSMVLPNERPTRRISLAQVFQIGVGRRMAAAWVLAVLKLGTYWTCYIWLPSFLLHEMGQRIGKSTVWVLTAQLGQFVGMVTFGSFADRYGRRPAFCVYSLITAAALALLAFRWQWLAAHPSIFWVTMLFLGFGSGCTAGFGALLAELFPTEVRSTAMGATYNLARTVQLVAPVVVGAMKDAYGLSGGLSVPLVLALATASWVWVLPETVGIKLPKIFMSPRVGPRRGSSSSSTSVAAVSNVGNVPATAASSSGKALQPVAAASNSGLHRKI